MVDNFEVRRNFPFVAFLLACLGSLVELSGDPLGAPSLAGSYPLVEEFVSRGYRVRFGVGCFIPSIVRVLSLVPVY